MKPAEADRRTESQAGEQPASSFKSYYVLTLLTLVWSLSFLDRNIISVVLEPIKKEFVVSDTLLGLMVGFGFVIIYSVFAMPLARMADRRSRIGIIAIGVAFWSAMTSLGGFSPDHHSIAPQPHRHRGRGIVGERARPVSRGRLLSQGQTAFSYVDSLHIALRRHVRGLFDRRHRHDLLGLAERLLHSGPVRTWWWLPS